MISAFIMAFATASIDKESIMKYFSSSHSTVICPLCQFYDNIVLSNSETVGETRTKWDSRVIWEIIICKE